MVRVSAVSEHAGVSPGGTVWVGVRFEMRDDWHIYWPGQNDTGMATEIRATGTPGVSFGEVVWPAPERHTAPGGILDHVYHGDVTALIPVTAPEDAALGTDLSLSFDVAWLVCETVCVPGWETVTVTLPVVEAPVLTEGCAGVFAAARARIPERPSPAERVVTASWDSDRVMLRARGADRMAFYPDPACSPVADLLIDGAREGDSLTLRLKDGVGAGGGAPVLSGMVEIFARDGRSRVYQVRSAPERPDGLAQE